MTPIKARLERNQQVLDKQRQIDRQFVAVTRRQARDWNDYCMARFGDKGKELTRQHEPRAKRTARIITEFRRTRNV